MSDLIRNAARSAGVHAANLVCALLIVLLFDLPVKTFAQTDTETCLDCHDDSEMTADDGRNVAVLRKTFSASVHADFDCVDCHTSPGDYEDMPHYAEYVPVDCGDCHDDAVADYEASVHHLGRARRRGAATCVSCHGTHGILPVSDTAAPVSHDNIPNLCGECHRAEPHITEDHIRLPVALPSYLASVHGEAWQEGEETAVCTDCHGAHRIAFVYDPESPTNPRNVSKTCGTCHREISEEYGNSIHGKAVALGIPDSPTCTDCHAEHLIQKRSDPRAKVSPEHRAKELCGDCHTDPELVAKYGIQGGVVETYLDSYHGWATDRGSTIAATCTDCHNVHDIRSPMDPLSSVHGANVVATCSRCHKGVTDQFASSYTHASALKARGAHGWVKLFYVGLIAVVLGGMVLHNLVVARYELVQYLRRRRGEPYVVRWRKAERGQHFVLLLSFTGLAVTGFALRYPNAWWVSLIGLGGHEFLRANLHRAFGVTMIASAFYHMAWVLVTRRGRLTLKEISPKLNDMREARENLFFHLSLRRKRPAFGQFDYTQKAEYWAVVWGTWIMALSGLVLWYPTIATRWMPAWIIRVSEVIHFYEAVLAVSAIFIWHFFYVIFLPREYPMSTIWLDGRMPEDDFREMHGGAYQNAGPGAVVHPDESGEANESFEPETKGEGPA